MKRWLALVFTCALYLCSGIAADAITPSGGRAECIARAMRAGAESNGNLTKFVRSFREIFNEHALASLAVGGATWKGYTEEQKNEQLQRMRKFAFENLLPRLIRHAKSRVIFTREDKNILHGIIGGSSVTFYFGLGCKLNDVSVGGVRLSRVVGNAARIAKRKQRN